MACTVSLHQSACVEHFVPVGRAIHGHHLSCMLLDLPAIPKEMIVDDSEVKYYKFKSVFSISNDKTHISVLDLYRK